MSTASNRGRVRQRSGPQSRAPQARQRRQERERPHPGAARRVAVRRQAGGHHRGARLHRRDARVGGIEQATVDARARRNDPVPAARPLRLEPVRQVRLVPRLEGADARERVTGALRIGEMARVARRQRARKGAELGRVRAPRAGLGRARRARAERPARGSLEHDQDVLMGRDRLGDGAVEVGPVVLRAGWVGGAEPRGRRPGCDVAPDRRDPHPAGPEVLHPREPGAGQPGEHERVGPEPDRERRRGRCRGGLRCERRDGQAGGDQARSGDPRAGRRAASPTAPDSGWALPHEPRCYWVWRARQPVLPMLAGRIAPGFGPSSNSGQSPHQRPEMTADTPRVRETTLRGVVLDACRLRAYRAALVCAHVQDRHGGDPVSSVSRPHGRGGARACPASCGPDLAAGEPDRAPRLARLRARRRALDPGAITSTGLFLSSSRRGPSLCGARPARARPRPARRPRSRTLARPPRLAAAHPVPPRRRSAPATPVASPALSAPGPAAPPTLTPVGDRNITIAPDVLRRST